MTRRYQGETGYAVLEYSLLIGLVVAALMAFQVYCGRGMKAGLKIAADRMSPYYPADPSGTLAQIAGIRYESGDRQNKAFVNGATVDTRSASQRNILSTVQTDVAADGSVTMSHPVPETTVSTPMLKTVFPDVTQIEGIANNGDDASSVSVTVVSVDVHK